MLLNYKTFLHFLFPPSDDERAIESASVLDFIEKMEDTSAGTTTALLPYSDPQVRSAIHLLKFHNHPHAKKLLAGVLAEHLRQQKHMDVCIPIPLSKRRLRERGFNQVTSLIEKSLSMVPGPELHTRLLVRTKHTTPQTTLAREARLTNVSDAFGIRDIRTAQLLMSEKHILLIDDVTTTGATLKSARETLEQASPASITCLALAH